MLAPLERRAAAWATWGGSNWDASWQVIADWDKSLAAEPPRESTARRMARRMGV